MANAAVVGILRALLTADSAEFETAMKRGAESAKQLTRDLKTTGQQMSSIGASMTKLFTLPLVAIGATVTKLSMDFESSFAGVRKTVDATEPEFAAMAASFRAMSKEIPVNVNEINRLGEAAGALGIPKAEIVDFARVMALLGVTTNVTSDQAAESIAKIQNIFGAAGKDTERFASTLVALGNDGASTEVEILELTKRIAGAGHIVGLTQAQVLSFGSALANVGINAEAGGSAISRIFLKMNDAVMSGGDKLKAFAKIADDTAAGFKKSFETDAAGAMVEFVKGLGRIHQEGGNVNAAIEKLIGKNIILKDTLLRLSGAGEMLTTTLATGNKAWEDNSALMTEARERFKTTEAQLKQLWIRIQDVGITIGNALKPAIDLAISGVTAMIPLIDSLGRGFAGLPPVVHLAILGFAAALAAAGPLLIVFGQMAIAASSLTGAFAAKGLAMRALAWSAGFLLNPITLIVGALGLLAAGIYVAVTAETELERSLRTNTDAFKASTAQLESALDVYTRLSGKQNLTKEETNKLEAAMRELAKSSGLSVDAFKKEEEQAGRLTIALREQLKARQDLLEEAIEMARGKWLDASAEQAKNQAQLTRVLTGQALTSDPFGNISSMAPRERVAEVERLNKVIGDQAKQVDAAREAYQRMAGTTGKDIVLTDASIQSTTRLARAKGSLADETEKGTKAVDAHAESVKKLVDAFTKKNIADEITLTAEAVSQLTDEQRKNLASSPEFIRQLDTWARAGQKIPPILADIHRSSITTFFHRLAAEQKPVVDFFNSVKVGAADVALMLPRAEGAVTDFFNSVKAVTPDGLFTLTLPDGGGTSDFLKLLDPTEVTTDWTAFAGVLTGIGGSFTRLGQDGSAGMRVISGAIDEAMEGLSRHLQLLASGKKGLSGTDIATSIGTFGISLIADLALAAAAEHARNKVRNAANLEHIHELQREITKLGAIPVPILQGTRAGIFAPLGRDIDALQRQLNNLIGTEQKLAEWREREIDRGEALFEQLLDLGGRLPSSMQGAIDRLVELGSISGETRDALLGLDDGPDWKELQRLAEQYGVDIAALGPSFQQAKLAETGIEIARAWALMAQPGANINAILEGMKDEVQDVITNALRMGLEVPESMRPIIQRLIEMGGLTDENGQKLEDLSRLSFSTALEDSIQALVDVIRELLRGLGLIPSAADEAARAMKDAFYAINPQPDKPRSPSPPAVVADIPVSSVTAPGFAFVRPGDILGMPALGPFPAIGTDAIGASLDQAALGGAAFGGAGASSVNVHTQHIQIIAWDGQSVDTWLRHGGARKLAVGIMPELPGALKPFGVTRR